MSPEPEQPRLRIGTVEREAAVAALNEHLQAGRLNSDEYVERVSAANAAVTVDQLRPLFADLPAPHPPILGPAVPVPAPGSTAHDRPAVSPWAHRLVALSPFVAILLFFLVHSWLVFLLVPIAGVIVYGSDRGRRS